MAVSTSKQPTVEDYHSDGSPTRANAAKKRSNPSMNNLQKDKVNDAASEVATDSGYSSKSAATVSSRADSTRGTKQEKTPNKAPSMSSSKVSSKSASKPAAKVSNARPASAEAPKKSSHSKVEERPSARHATAQPPGRSRAPSKVAQSRNKVDEPPCTDLNCKECPPTRSPRASKQSSPRSAAAATHHGPPPSMANSDRTHARRPSMNKAQRPASFHQDFNSYNQYSAHPVQTQHGPPPANSAYFQQASPPPPMPYAPVAHPSHYAQGYAQSPGGAYASSPAYDPYQQASPPFGYDQRPPPVTRATEDPYSTRRRSAVPPISPTAPYVDHALLPPGGMMPTTTNLPSARYRDPNPKPYLVTTGQAVDDESETSESEDELDRTARAQEEARRLSRRLTDVQREQQRLMPPPQTRPRTKEYYREPSRNRHENRESRRRAPEYDEGYDDDEHSARGYRGRVRTNSSRGSSVRPSLASSDYTGGTKATSYNGSNGAKVVVDRGRRQSYMGPPSRGEWDSRVDQFEVYDEEGYSDSDYAYEEDHERPAHREKITRPRVTTAPQRNRSVRQPARPLDKAQQAEQYQRDTTAGGGREKVADAEFLRRAKAAGGDSERPATKSRVSQGQKSNVTGRTNGEIRLHLQDAQDYSVSIGEGMEGKTINLSAAEGGGMDLVVSERRNGTGTSYQGSSSKSYRSVRTSAPSQRDSSYVVRDDYRRNQERERQRPRTIHDDEVRPRPRRQQQAEVHYEEQRYGRR